MTHHSDEMDAEEFFKYAAILTGKALWHTGKATYYASKFLAKNGYKLYKHLSDKNDSNTQTLLNPPISNTENKDLVKIIRENNNLSNQQQIQQSNNLENNRVWRILNHNNYNNQDRQDKISMPLNTPQLQLPELNLNRETFLDYFISEGKRLVFNNGKVYCYGREPQLIEVESVSLLEQIFLDKNNQEIKNFKDSTLNYLTVQNKELNAKIKSLKHHSSSNPLDKFILNYLIPTINKEKPVKTTNVKEQEIPNLDENSIINNQRKSFLEKFLSKYYKQYQGFVLFEKSIMGIPKRDRLSQILNTNSTSSITENCENLCSGEEINNNYVDFIENQIKENLEKITNPLTKSLREKNFILNKTNKVPEKIQNIYFERKSNSEYIIYKDLDKFIVKYNTDFFLFPRANIGLRLISKNGKLKLKEQPFVYKSKDYNHPFVSTIKSKEKEICLGNANSHSFKEKFWKINQNNDESIAKSILMIFKRTENILYNIKENNPNKVYCDIRDSSGEKIKQYEVNSLKNKGVPVFG